MGRVALPDVNEGDAVEVAAWLPGDFFNANQPQPFKCLFRLADSARRHLANIGYRSGGLPTLAAILARHPFEVAIL
jgi:hypothetical protein